MHLRIVNPGSSGDNWQESADLTSFLDAEAGRAVGTTIYRSATGWVGLAPGPALSILYLNSSGVPAWLAPGTSGQTLKAAADGTPTWTT